MQHEIQQFWDNCLAWDRAIETNDVEKIGAFMAEDWVCVATDGGKTTKAAFLGVIASRDLSHNKMTSDEHEIRLYGNTGIVISKGISSGNYKGQAFTFYEWSTSVFIIENSKWQCVTTMLTPVKRI